MPLAETIRRDSDPDPDREAALGHRDHFARIARQIVFLLCSEFPRGDNVKICHEARIPIVAAGCARRPVYI